MEQTKSYKHFRHNEVGYARKDQSPSKQATSTAQIIFGEVAASTRDKDEGITDTLLPDYAGKVKIPVGTYPKDDKEVIAEMV